MALNDSREELFTVFDYTLDTFKKHVLRNCDQETADKILRNTQRDLRRIAKERNVPKIGIL